MNTIETRSIHEWPDAKWQVIFQTADGYDYCRETFSATMSLDEVKTTVERLIKNHPHVTGAYIEKW